ncbi:putative quinol monooxygenase [Micrococcus lylae]|uniref:Antibiotic biosynthesis monooxygenase n=1 Tax=Micrococcus lylae TaxID=1273 RepID=A0A1R4JHW5_9MICC|nr:MULTISPECIES: putative quinol monooxygenase [Micrococcus]MCT2008453.1 antibiotic biosynthesis monooxygenase [Micrococcus lylae]MCT2072404.1 antibiotic biosynthesis monooxygenase [Micrococcus lylae]OFR86431.1 antibiotic biosynthesis monooxygenase [Micrococcus sp. HMSC067E09]PNL17262.1 antibiotic biosynthesis monooxygenase [Micrococcus sp. FDAARGOS_333]TFH98620.1 antibiotic biosynthesis monooxygenase [Micrococcus lylae]
MILINLKFTVKPELADQWMDAVAKYTADVRSEEGNMFFEWYQPVEGEKNEYFLLEGFTDEGAKAHVESPHFQEGIDAMKPLLAKTPQIISEQISADGFGPMGEIQIDE